LPSSLEPEIAWGNFLPPFAVAKTIAVMRVKGLHNRDAIALFPHSQASSLSRSEKLI
jgi:hypothetical protein